MRTSPPEMKLSFSYSRLKFVYLTVSDVIPQRCTPPKKNSGSAPVEPNKTDDRRSLENQMTFNFFSKLMPRRGEKNSSQTHKTGSWCILGVLLKISTEHARAESYFIYGICPPPPTPTPALYRGGCMSFNMRPKVQTSGCRKFPWSFTLKTMKIID